MLKVLDGLPDKRPLPLDLTSACRIRSCAALHIGRKAAHAQLVSHWDEMLQELSRSGQRVLSRDLTHGEWPWQCWIAALSSEGMMTDAIGPGIQRFLVELRADLLCPYCRSRFPK